MTPNNLDQINVKQLLPQQKKLPLNGLYLRHELKKIAEKLNRAIVVTNYVSDTNDVIAEKDEEGKWQVARDVKNPHDWRLFQEVLVQSDVMITGTDYLKRFEEKGKGAQDVLTQFDEGEDFEDLGNWRLENGFDKRYPDIAILSRSLDFSIPSHIVDSNRKIIIFTTYDMRGSKPCKKLEAAGAEVFAAGENGVDGKILYNTLNKRGYKVIKMSTGPRVLKILLDANVLDRFYHTVVQIEIDKLDNEVQKILIDGGKVENLSNFKLVEKYFQDKVETDTGKLTSQEFRVYDNKNFKY